MISIERRGNFVKYTEKVSLEYALENKLITPQEAQDKNHCSAAYLRTRGWNRVNFNYKSHFGLTHSYEGTLRSALKKGCITIQEAISLKFITEAQAIEGGFLKPDKAAK
jgi:hypothetical protein